MKNQIQMYYDAVRRDGMTRGELQKLIDKRPERYGRFSGWLERLPES